MSIKYLFNSFKEASRLEKKKKLFNKTLSVYIGTIVFKVIPCPLEYIEIRKGFRAQESALDIIQNPSMDDRTLIDYFPMLIEVNHSKVIFLLKI